MGCRNEMVLNETLVKGFDDWHVPERGGRPRGVLVEETDGMGAALSGLLVVCSSPLAMEQVMRIRRGMLSVSPFLEWDNAPS